MRVLNTDLTSEFAKEVLREFYMVEFIFTDTYRFNTTEEGIYDSVNHNLFTPRDFSFDSISFFTGSSVSELSIIMDDVDQVLSALLLGEDIRNKVVKLYIGLVVQDITDEYAPLHIVTQEFMRGIVSGWELSEDSLAKIIVKNELVLWSKKVSRTCQSSCPWVFWEGGVAPDGCPECRYSGSETWCDQSYDRCLALGNTDNYGGFRFLPGLMQKEIWWGRSPNYKE